MLMRKKLSLPPIPTLNCVSGIIKGTEFLPQRDTYVKDASFFFLTGVKIQMGRDVV